ncbi:MAG TPA: MFS transporter [Rectinemataceae bacterium]|nr:MFS transporter [Rectinemataceae bacterium]
MATLLLAIIYIAFISLGLPDALLGASWPAMQSEFAVPFGFAGFASMLISGGTILSSILGTRMLRRFGTGRVTAVSVGLTAAALFGFAAAPSFWWLLIAAVPLGLGGGAVDSGLNAYVAEHYESRHMSWLHSFWGLGALSGPLLLARLLGHGASWRGGYLTIAILQSVLVVVLVLAVPLWDKVRRRASSAVPKGAAGAPKSAAAVQSHQPLFFPLKVKGVKLALVTFFFYCGIESTMGLWGGSYLFKTRGLDLAAAATWVSMFYASITAGRFLTGFMTYKVSNKDLIRWGALFVLAGIVLLVAPLPLPFALAGFLLAGFGCAPIFPCMIHETPDRFGVANAQAIIGFQMAMAYIGTTLLPPTFGFIASASSLSLMPFFLLAYIGVLIFSTEKLRKKLAV